MLREKIVAAASKKLVILIGPEHVAEKLVPTLGRRGRLPVEVVPFGLPLCLKRLADLGLAAEPVRDGQKLILSDNGNHIVECLVSAIEDPHALEQRILAIPGVVDTGIFLRQVLDLVLGGSDQTAEFSDLNHAVPDRHVAPAAQAHGVFKARNFVECRAS